MNPGNAMIGAMAVGLVYGIVSLLPARIWNFPPRAPDGCACRRSRRTGSDRTARPGPSPGPAEPFLGGLEDKVHGAIEIAWSGRGATRRPAASSCARHGRRRAYCRRVDGGRTRWLRHRQAVHVGAQADGARRVAWLRRRPAGVGRCCDAPRCRILQLLRRPPRKCAASSKPSSGWAWMSRRHSVRLS